jgi:pyridoxal phosphate enzyme (YggS family)
LISSETPVAQRLSEINERIFAACDKSGRPAGCVDLVAISKRQPVESIREAYAAGQTVFAENYVQELKAKQIALAEFPTITWQFTGHLQSNKAKLVVGACNLIQSVDSYEIAGKIARIALSKDTEQSVLVEANIGCESTKTGVPLDDVLEMCEQIAVLDGIRILGLMGIGPALLRVDRAAVHTGFARLKRLFDQLPGSNRKILSMGMSGDFEEAIAEGSTMIRIGTALFGHRPE